MPRTIGTHDDEAGSSRSKCSRQYETVEDAMLARVHHSFLLWEGCNEAAKNWNVLYYMSCGEEIDEMLTIKLALDTTTLKELIESKGRLILEVPKPGVPRFAIPRPPRASMQDLYEMMGSMEIR
uniref:Uncharacterized protein n=1 Tax=Tanacetum cinerariifolium TaxID=118510 RepID=A0A699GQ28_TANCI|nr:hypothetical protein [Tanacetum cinerariifolium]